MKLRTFAFMTIVLIPSTGQAYDGHCVFAVGGKDTASCDISSVSDNCKNQKFGDLYADCAALGDNSNGGVFCSLKNSASLANLKISSAKDKSALPAGYVGTTAAIGASAGLTLLTTLNYNKNDYTISCESVFAAKK